MDSKAGPTVILRSSFGRMARFSREFFPMLDLMRVGDGPVFLHMILKLKLWK